jgi:hypothetical protein
VKTLSEITYFSKSATESPDYSKPSRPLQDNKITAAFFSPRNYGSR